MPAKKKPKTPKLTVGQILQARREQLGRSLNDVELATKIRGKFLVFLEASDYHHLANNIYTHGFVRTYATYLGLDAAKLVQEYIKERGGPAKVTHSNPAKRSLEARKIVLTPKLLLVAVALGLVAVIGAYLAYQFSFLAAAPRLELVQPQNDQVIYGSLVDVAGTAGGGAEVFVNNSPILTDGNGRFSDKLALQEGVNTVTVTARNRLGKTTTVVRNILARLPRAEEGAVVFPKESFDGVAALVTINDEATKLIVEVDGKEEFNATMLAGTSRTFRGATQIKISTFNAGNTSLRITNAAVANESLGTMGAAGEVKRDQVYGKDQTF
jgi:hypothetical protein